MIWIEAVSIDSWLQPPGHLRIRRNEFASNHASPADGQDNPAPKVLKQMIGPRIKLLLDATNKVEKIEGYNEFTEQAIANVAPWAKWILRQMCGEDFLRQVVDFSNLLPKNVQQGHVIPSETELHFGGDKARFGLNSTFTGWESKDGARCVRLDFSGPVIPRVAPPDSGGDWPMKAARTAGKIWFDPRLGAVVEAQLEQRLYSDPPTSAEQGSNETSLQTTLKLVAVDKARP
ncbi:MAG: hypothetical protein EXS31_03230 [Pedosphaera sp.]|nr:hypothetical protein [Pedosphaera sp.]